jgi:CelD/BcsL family acetyltransferase involved in cellulose biosynthesis
MAPMKFTRNVVTDRSSLQKVSAEWRAFLAEPGVSGGIYCDPTYIEETLEFSRYPSLEVLSGFSDGRRSCMLPLRVRRHRQVVRAGPWAVPWIVTRVSSLPDFEFAIREGFSRHAVFADAVAFIRAERGVDACVADNVPVPAGDAPRPPGWAFHNQQVSYLVTMPDTFQAYSSSLSSSVRRSFERRRKALAAKCGDAVTMRKFAEPADMAELHEHLMAVWRKSWHAKFGRYLPPSPAVLVRFAGLGWVRSYVLFAAGVPVAYQLGYHYGDTFYGDSIAFDSAWRDVSPGKVLSHLMIREFFESRPPAVLDFGFGYNDYKRDLGNRAENRAVLSVPLTARGRIAAAGSAAVERITAGARNAARRLGIHKQMRDRLHEVSSSP